MARGVLARRLLLGSRGRNCESVVVVWTAAVTATLVAIVSLVVAAVVMVMVEVVAAVVEGQRGRRRAMVRV